MPMGNRSLLSFISLIWGHTALLISAAKGKEKEEENTVSKFPVWEGHTRPPAMFQEEQIEEWVKITLNNCSFLGM